MQCLQCGEDQSAENLFCRKCGARLSAGPPPVPSPEKQPGEASASSPSAKDAEDQILRELKEALKGVEPKKAPEDEEPVAEKPRWSTATKLTVTGVAIGLILFAATFFQMLRKRIGHPALSPASMETPLKPDIATPPLADDSSRTTVGKMAAILEAIEHYAKTKRLPPSLTSLNRSYADPEALKDGWGQNILYLVDLTNRTFVLRSIGPDGKRQTEDDIWVDSDSRDGWVKEHEQIISEWKVANPNLQAQLVSVGPSPEELKKLEAARKLEEEKKKQETEASALAKKQDQEQKQKRLEAARLEEESRRRAEAQKREEEERRQARAREEALRQQQAVRRPESIKENFIDGLNLWDAPPTWELVKDKDVAALRIQGLGFLKKGEQWDNYKVEFEVKVNKESAGWVLRAQNTNNFYLFKLASEKAKAIPKNSLVKYIRSDDKYLNSLKREDAPGAAGVTPLSFKVRNKDYHRIMLVVRGNAITHYIDGIQVDVWSDDTFDRGRFGFNASAIEQATIRSLSVEPLR